MKNVNWLSIAIFGLLAGYSFIQYLVQPPALMALFVALLIVMLGGAFFTLIKLFHGKQRIWAGVFVLFCFLTGYALANSVFLSQEEVRVLPPITRTDGGDGHTAIIYFTHGEPPSYSAMPWIETIRELDHDNVPFVPWFFRPFFFNSLRNEYLMAGGSPHNVLHQMFLEELMRAMPEEVANGTRFYLAFLDSNPRPDEAAINAINDGASKIILLPVFITESTHTIAGEEMVADVHPELYGIPVSYTGALWDSESLQNVFIQHAIEMTKNVNKTKVGILLVGHGQPTEWEALYPNQNQQEDQYRESIKTKMITAGFAADHIKLGWMEFQEPTITDAAKTLAEEGIEKLLVFSVSLSAHSIHSDIEVPAAVAEARLPNSISIDFVSQYGDHPLAIQALVDKINSSR